MKESRTPRHPWFYAARANYRRLGLDRDWIRQVGNHVEILLWRCDRISGTLLLMLQARSFKGLNEGLCLSLAGTTIASIDQALREIAGSEGIEPEDLARSVEKKIREKWDALLPPELLNASFASSYIDISGVGRALAECIEVH
jgi:ATP-dependent Lhr-like helicase